MQAILYACGVYTESKLRENGILFQLIRILTPKKIMCLFICV